MKYLIIIQYLGVVVLCMAGFILIIAEGDGILSTLLTKVFALPCFLLAWCLHKFYQWLNKTI